MKTKEELLMEQFEPNKCYTVAEIVLGLYNINVYIHPMTIYKAIWKGKLKGDKLANDRKLYVKGNDIVEYFFSR